MLGLRNEDGDLFGFAVNARFASGAFVSGAVLLSTQGEALSQPTGAYRLRTNGNRSRGLGGCPTTPNLRAFLSAMSCIKLRSYHRKKVSESIGSSRGLLEGYPLHEPPERDEAENLHDSPPTACGVRFIKHIWERRNIPQPPPTEPALTARRFAFVGGAFKSIAV